MISSRSREEGNAIDYRLRKAAEAQRSDRPERDAFATSFGAAHARSSGSALSPPEAAARWRALCDTAGPVGPRALYVHLPFCVHRCVFCPFYRYASAEETIAAYLKTLHTELAWAARSRLYTGRPIDAVYFGGGTPSDLSAEQLAGLLRALRSALPLAADCEITVEGRAASFTREKLEAWASEGTNRISLGVQTFDGPARRRLGRILGREALLDRLRELADHPGITLCVDLIYGLPGQGPAAWREELRTLLDESAAHAWDAYRLKAFPQSPLLRLIGAGRLEPLPERLEVAQDLAALHGAMRRPDVRRLSIYHWSRDARERSRYNFLAKTAPVLLPLGAGAGGHVGEWQVMQHGGLEAHAAAVAAGESPIAALSATEAPWRACREVAAGAERGAWSLAELEAAAGRRGLGDFLAPLFAQWRDCGLVTAAGDGAYALTLAGELWNVELQQRLLAVIGRFAIGRS